MRTPDPKPPKRVHVKSYGCQMNVYDGSRMLDVLRPLGYAPTESMDGADLVILNTCHIREKASEKVYSELGRLRTMKDERRAAGAPPLVVAVAGCVAQAEGEEILARAPIVDLVFGPQAYHRLPELLAAFAPGKPAVATDFPVETKFDLLPEERLASGPTAFVTIQEGCDKFCSFCVVPYTRGAEYSRPVAQIEAEIVRLLARGVREVTLLGQNVNAYHGLDERGRTLGLGALCRRLARLEGLARIRYTTSHPRDMDEELIAAHGEVEALMPYLHLPVQSGSDRILAAMNRRHTVADYLDLIGRIRAARPDIALSTDFIVGYPGETDDDFAASLALIDAVGFAASFSFKYSARPGTPAAEAPDLDEAIKSERLEILQERLRRQQIAFNEGTVGRRLQVLFEKPGRHPGQIVGRSPYLQAVHTEGPASHIGSIRFVDMVRLDPNSLYGRLALAASEQEPRADAFA